MAERELRLSENNLSSSVSGALASEDPIGALTGIAKLLPKQRLSPKDWLSLVEGISNDDLAVPVKVFVWCLPQVIAIAEKVRGLGVEDKEVVAEALRITAAIIGSWLPNAGKKGLENYLRFRIINYGGNYMELWLAERYGLERTYFPTIKLYFEARRQFSMAFGRSPEYSDLREIRRIVEEEKCRFWSKDGSAPVLIRVRKKNDPWEGDIIARLHAINCPAIHSSSEEPESCREQRALKGVIVSEVEKVIGRLSPEEKIILRLSISGYSLKEISQIIAKRLGIAMTRQRVWQKLGLIRRRLKGWLGPLEE